MSPMIIHNIAKCAEPNVTHQCEYVNMSGRKYFITSGVHIFCRIIKDRPQKQTQLWIFVDIFVDNIAIE